VGLRLLFLLLAGNLEPQADESHYLYLATIWQHFGIYSDCAYYLWPPGYPLFLGLALQLFGASGIFAAKLCQVLLSGIVGLTTMLVAARLFSRRAAVVAGILWSLYLPLIGFTHYLWPETLYLAAFLPALYLLIVWWQQSERTAVSNRYLIAAGVLLGLSLLIKEVGLWWCAGLVLLVLARDLRQSVAQAASRAILFALSMSVVVLPWTLRNHEVYGRWTPVGATLGQNMYWGLNSTYLNFDYTPAQLSQLAQLNPRTYRWLLAAPPPAWQRSTAPNVIDRSAEDVRRGLQYAGDHPAFAARTRIKKLADWATPLSFFVRHYALDRYHGVLASPAVRRPLLTAALLLPLLVLAAAIPGFWGSLRTSGAWPVLAFTLLYFIPTTALVNGMSRYRTPIEPLLIVLAAGFLSGAAWRSWSRPAMVVSILGCAALAFLWWLNAPEVLALVQNAW
jgi:4-amino-4-deoxy-L-arabinose transferase-like glycosyltransferase